MKAETAERVLSLWLPWVRSILEAREEVGFSLDFTDNERWQWIVAGGHRRARDLGLAALERLALPDLLVTYWMSCLYSPYAASQGSFAAVRGRPWLRIPCPATEDLAWRSAVAGAKAAIMAAHGCQDEDQLAWRFFYGLSEKVGDIALSEIQRLGRPPEDAARFVCCLLPAGAKWMADRATPVFSRQPQLLPWRDFACSSCHRPRPKALPPTPFVRWAGRLHSQVVELEWDMGLVPKEDVHDFIDRLYERKRANTHAVRALVHRAKALLPSEKRAIIEDQIRRYRLGEADLDELLWEEWERELPDLEADLAQADEHDRSRIIGERANRIYERVTKRLRRAGLQPPRQRPGWWARK